MHDAAPKVLWNRPVLQATQAEADGPANLPAAHATVLDAPPGQYEPWGQAEHDEAPVTAA